jgi:phosphoenolpyruvate carboxylase
LREDLTMGQWLNMALAVESARTLLAIARAQQEADDQQAAESYRRALQGLAEAATAALAEQAERREGERAELR